MSTAVISTSAAQSRFFSFEAENEPEACWLHTESWNLAKALRSKSALPVDPSTINPQKAKILSSVAPASQLAVRPSPEMVSSGIGEIDALTGGLPRGCLTEIVGGASCGGTTILLAALAAATRRGEVCAVVDASDALHPHSATAAGIELERLLWVRCGEDLPQSQKSDQQKLKFEQKKSRSSESSIEQVLRVTDWLIESGGFGMIVLDLCDLPSQMVRRIPLTTWFRFRRAVEHTSTVLVALERQSIAGSCSSLLIKLGAAASWIKAEGSQVLEPAHARLLTTVGITAEVVRSRIERKPAGSVSFAGKMAWAG